MKKTHIESVRQRNASVRMQVLNVLGWDEMKYAQLQEQSGRDWVADRMGSDTYMSDEILKHRAYWAWWRMHWARRDAEFLDMAGMLFSKELESYYRELHTPNAIGYFPHSPILDATYGEMIHKLVKEAVR